MKTNDVRGVIHAEIDNERDRQDAKFGAENTKNSISEWLCIAGEEYGEACQAANDLRKHSYSAASIAHLREELIQSTAVLIAIVEQIDAKNQNLFL